MPAPHISTNFPDCLDPTFRDIRQQEYDQLPDMIGTLFSTPGTGPRGDQVKVSSVGTLGDWDKFTGNVSYDSQNQGYDVVATHVEFTKGVKVERKLYDDNRFDGIFGKPKAMAASQSRTRQKDAAKIFNSAFSNVTEFYVNSEAVALCSNSHTTTSGASTSSGFDNLGTSAISATAVRSAYIAMNGFRDDRAELFDINPDEIWFPVNLYGEAFEIVKSMGNPENANNAANVHEGTYTLRQWNRLTDTNNWFMADSRMRKMSLEWFDRVAPEFAMVEDFETLIGKWRGYMRYSYLWRDWRWIYGYQVS